MSVSSVGLFLRGNAFSCLLLCYVLFVVLGGVVFNMLERPVEEQLRGQVEELRVSFLGEHPCVQERRLHALLHRTLSAHQANVAVLKADSEERQFDFSSSLLFVIVTLTTMGSDSYTLKSGEAKLFSVLYCALGIPVTLFLLTLLSRLLLPVLTHSPVRLLRTLWGLSTARAALVHACVLSLCASCLLLVLPACLLCLSRPACSFLDALFSCFLVLSTVGQTGDALGADWSPEARQRVEVLTTGYLLLGLVVILTLKDTVLQVPQVSAVVRLVSGPHCSELEGLHFDELSLSEEDCCEEESQYSQCVCTVSSTPLQMLSLGSDHKTLADVHGNTASTVPNT